MGSPNVAMKNDEDIVNDWKDRNSISEVKRTNKGQRKKIKEKELEGKEMKKLEQEKNLKMKYKEEYKNAQITIKELEKKLRTKN